MDLSWKSSPWPSLVFGLIITEAKKVEHATTDCARELPAGKSANTKGVLLFLPKTRLPM